MSFHVDDNYTLSLSGNDLQLSKNGAVVSTQSLASLIVTMLAASNVTVDDTAGNYAGTNVEDVLAEIATMLTGLTHTSITGIDLQPTSNPNEFTVVINWTDSDGNAQTTTDATPVTISSPDAFTDLNDTPAAYAGFGGFTVKVRADETGLEFVQDTVLQVVEVPGSASIAANTCLQRVNSATASTQTLPAANAVPAGHEVRVKRVGGGNVVVQAAGSDTIDITGTTSWDFSADPYGGNGPQGASRTFKSNGTNQWTVV